jgi:tRNA pseudouridine38-40 synthase
MSAYFRFEINLTGCGRTDSGVHAKDYYAHFDSPEIPQPASHVYRLNKMLPQEIAIHDILPVHDGAHARFDATSRSYEYHLHTLKDPFAGHSLYYPYGLPDINILYEAAGLLLAFNDFNTFCKYHSDVKTTLCQVNESYWRVEGNRYIYRISADRFLRGMIRLVVGMCLQVDRGKLTLDQVKMAMEQGVRTGHDWSVSPDGLFLCDIRYPYLPQ